MTAHLLTLLSEFNPLLVTISAGVYLFWTACYAWVIHHAWKHKRCGMPIFAVTTMLAFEILFIFVWPVAKGNPVWGVGEWVWLIADIILLLQCWLYGRDTFHAPLLRKHLGKAILGALVLSVAGLATFVQAFGMQDGFLPAIAALSIVSITMPMFVLQVRDASWLSARGQAARLLGDLCSGAAIWMVFPFTMAIGASIPESLNNPFTNYLLAVMIGCDVFVVALIARPRFNDWKAATRGAGHGQSSVASKAPASSQNPSTTR